MEQLLEMAYATCCFMESLSQHARHVFDTLEGVWEVERIVDGQASLFGHACFQSIAENELHFCEHGILKLNNGRQISARQSYVYRLYENCIHVYFDETPARAFHTINLVMNPLGILEGFGFHQCRADSYRITYLFPKDNSFKIQYKIHGPSKDYTIACCYSREHAKSNSS